MDNFSPTSKFPFLYIYACQAVAMQQYSMSSGSQPLLGGIQEESKTKKEDESSMIGKEALAQLFSFLANAATSVVFLIITFTTNSTCHIRNTYRQDFLSKIQSDPFYSSTNVFRSGPLPQPSSVEGNKTLYSHLHSDIGIFPVMAYKDSDNSYPYLGRALNSQQALYFFAKNKGGGVSTAVDMTMDSKAQMMMMQTGSGQVDYLRCLSISPGNSAADLKHKMDAMRKSSRRMGTCLLTGQHATVDISGNPRTSMVLFSSVNPMFMASVVLWISTSFSLFYFGKSAIKYLKDNRNWTMKRGSAGSWNWGISDTVLLICTLWNVVPAIVFLTPLAQHHNIPVNNSVLAFIAIMITVAVQWYFANLDDNSAAATGAPITPASRFSMGGGKQYFFSTKNFFPAYPFGEKGYMAMGNAITTNSYMNNIQSEERAKETLQCSERTITVPLLISVAFSSLSSTVPTEMAYKLFILLVQLSICYRLIHTFTIVQTDTNTYYFNLTRGFFLLKIVVLTASILMIELEYLLDAKKQGESISLISDCAVGFIVGYHLLTTISYTLQMLGFIKYKTFSGMHSVLDFFFRLIISILVFAAVSSSAFAAPHCNLWGFS